MEEEYLRSFSSRISDVLRAYDIRIHGCTESKTRQEQQRLITELEELVDGLNDACDVPLFVETLTETGERFLRERRYRIALDVCFRRLYYMFCSNPLRVDSKAEIDSSSSVRIRFEMGFELARIACDTWDIDPSLSLASSVDSCIAGLTKIRRCIDPLLSNEGLYYVVSNGIVYMVMIARRLLDAAYPIHAVPALVYCICACECNVVLLSSTFIAFRCELYVTLARAYADLRYSGDNEAKKGLDEAVRALNRGIRKLDDMKSLEESDEVPPEEEVLQSYRENRFLLRCHRLRYEVIQLPSRISDPSKLASAIEEIVNECFPSLSSSEQEASPSHRVPLLAEALFSLFKSFSGQFLISSVARGYSLLSLLIGASKILFSEPISKFQDLLRLDSSSTLSEERNPSVEIELAGEESGLDRFVEACSSLPLDLHVSLSMACAFAASSSTSETEKAVANADYELFGTTVLLRFARKIDVPIANESPFSGTSILEIAVTLIDTFRRVESLGFDILGQSVTHVRDSSSLSLFLRECEALVDISRQSAQSEAFMTAYGSGIVSDFGYRAWKLGKDLLSLLDQSSASDESFFSDTAHQATMSLLRVSCTFLSASESPDVEILCTAALQYAFLCEESGNLRDGVEIVQLALDASNRYRDIYVRRRSLQVESSRDVLNLDCACALPSLYCRYIPDQSNSESLLFKSSRNYSPSTMSLSSQNIAVLQTDLWSAFFRLELRHGLQKARAAHEKKTREKLEAPDYTRKIPFETKDDLSFALSHPPDFAVRTEERLCEQFGRDPYLMGLLYLEMARYRRGKDAQQKLLSRAFDNFVEAEKSELKLSECLDPKLPWHQYSKRKSEALAMLDQPSDQPVLRLSWRGCHRMGFRVEVDPRMITEQDAHFAVLYGKNAALGAELTLVDRLLEGCGVPKLLSEEFIVSGLEFGEKYVFALQVLDSHGDAITNIVSTLPPAPILEAGSLDVDDVSRGIGRGILASHPLPLPCLFSDAALVAYSLSIARSDAHLSDGIFAAGSTLHGHHTSSPSSFLSGRTPPASGAPRVLVDHADYVHSCVELGAVRFFAEIGHISPAWRESPASRVKISPLLTKSVPTSSLRAVVEALLTRCRLNFGSLSKVYALKGVPDSLTSEIQQRLRIASDLFMTSQLCCFCSFDDLLLECSALLLDLIVIPSYLRLEPISRPKDLFELLLLLCESLFMVSEPSTLSPFPAQQMWVALLHQLFSQASSFGESEVLNRVATIFCHCCQQILDSISSVSPGQSVLADEVRSLEWILLTSPFTFQYLRDHHHRCESSKPNISFINSTSLSIAEKSQNYACNRGDILVLKDLFSMIELSRDDPLYASFVSYFLSLVEDCVSSSFGTLLQEPSNDEKRNAFLSNIQELDVLLANLSRSILSFVSGAPDLEVSLQALIASIRSDGVSLAAPLTGKDAKNGKGSEKKPNVKSKVDVSEPSSSSDMLDDETSRQKEAVSKISVFRIAIVRRRKALAMRHSARMRFTPILSNVALSRGFLRQAYLMGKRADVTDLLDGGSPVRRVPKEFLDGNASPLDSDSNVKKKVPASSGAGKGKPGKDAPQPSLNNEESAEEERNRARLLADSEASYQRSLASWKIRSFCSGARARTQSMVRVGVSSLGKDPSEVETAKHTSEASSSSVLSSSSQPVDMDGFSDVEISTLIWFCRSIILASRFGSNKLVLASASAFSAFYDRLHIELSRFPASRILSRMVWECVDALSSLWLEYSEYSEVELPGGLSPEFLVHFVSRSIEIRLYTKPESLVLPTERVWEFSSLFNHRYADQLLYPLLTVGETLQQSFSWIPQFEDALLVAERSKSKAVQKADLARNEYTRLILHTMDAIRPNSDVIFSLQSSCQKLMQEASTYARDKGDFTLLSSLLRDWASFCVIVQDVNSAKKHLDAAVDAVFQSLDAPKNWRSIFDDLLPEAKHLSSSRRSPSTLSSQLISFAAADVCSEIFLGSLLVNRVGMERCLIGLCVTGLSAKYCHASDSFVSLSLCHLASQLASSLFVSAGNSHAVRSVDISSFSGRVSHLSSFPRDHVIFESENISGPSLAESLRHSCFVLVQGAPHLTSLSGVSTSAGFEFVARDLVSNRVLLYESRCFKTIFLSRCGHLRDASMSLRQTLLLSDLPRFSCQPPRGISGVETPSSVFDVASFSTALLFADDQPLCSDINTKFFDSVISLWKEIISSENSLTRFPSLRILLFWSIFEFIACAVRPYSEVLLSSSCLQDREIERNTAQRWLSVGQEVLGDLRVFCSSLRESHPGASDACSSSSNSTTMLHPDVLSDLLHNFVTCVLFRCDSQLTRLRGLYSESCSQLLQILNLERDFSSSFIHYSEKFQESGSALTMEATCVCLHPSFITHTYLELFEMLLVQEKYDQVLELLPSAKEFCQGTNDTFGVLYLQLVERSCIAVSTSAMQSIDGIEELLEQVPNVDFFGYYTASWSFTAAVLLSMAASSVANISNERPDMSVQHLRERAETFLRKADSCLLRYLHALGYDDGTEDQERYLQYLPVDAVSLHLAVRIGWTRIHCAYAFSADADVVQRYTAEALSGDMTAEEECNRNAVALDTAISACLPLLRSALRIHRKTLHASPMLTSQVCFLIGSLLREKVLSGRKNARFGLALGIDRIHPAVDSREVHLSDEEKTLLLSHLGSSPSEVEATSTKGGKDSKKDVKKDSKVSSSAGLSTSLAAPLPWSSTNSIELPDSILNLESVQLLQEAIILNVQSGRCDLLLLAACLQELSLLLSFDAFRYPSLSNACASYAHLASISVLRSRTLFEYADHLSLDAPALDISKVPECIRGLLLEKHSISLASRASEIGISDQPVETDCLSFSSVCRLLVSLVLSSSQSACEIGFNRPFFPVWLESDRLSFMVHRYLADELPSYRKIGCFHPSDALAISSAHLLDFEVAPRLGYVSSSWRCLEKPWLFSELNFDQDISPDESIHPRKRPGDILTLLVVSQFPKAKEIPTSESSTNLDSVILETRVDFLSAPYRLIRKAQTALRYLCMQYRRWHEDVLVRGRERQSVNEPERIERLLSRERDMLNQSIALVGDVKRILTGSWKREEDEDVSLMHPDLASYVLFEGTYSRSRAIEIPREEELLNDSALSLLTPLLPIRGAAPNIRSFGGNASSSAESARFVPDIRLCAVLARLLSPGSALLLPHDVFSRIPLSSGAASLLPLGVSTTRSDLREDLESVVPEEFFGEVSSSTSFLPPHLLAFSFARWISLSVLPQRE